MIFFRKTVPIAVAVTAILVLIVCQANAIAPGPKVSAAGNKHNLSASNTGVKYRAFDDPVNNPRGQQICIFCHTPHSANVVGQTPLWNRKFSSETFQRYSGTALFQITKLAAAEYGSGAQPNGSSKLCLSCHDGVANLGEVFSGQTIAMAANSNLGDPNAIEGLASFKPSTNKMKNGHHPVSFVYTDAIATAINTGKSTATYKMPTVPPEVKLDKQGRMQCTTCHDAHQNKSDDDACYDNGGLPIACSTTDPRKIVPFWVSHIGTNTASQDHDAVCTACHALTTPAPW